MIKKEMPPNQASTAETPVNRRSLLEIISEEDFKKPLRDRAIPFFRLAMVTAQDKRSLSCLFYFNLMNEGDKLELFLDDHGAKENSTYHHFRDLIASIRNFSIAAFQLAHLLERYHDYAPAEPEHAAEEFLGAGREMLTYINDITAALITEAIAEFRRLGCGLRTGDVDTGDFKEVGRQEKLPRTLEMGSYQTTEQMVMRLAESYRKAAVKVSRERYGRRIEPEDFAKLIPTRVNETKIKILENTLHNLQTEYDTHIRKTQAEATDPDLTKLRSFISIPMHLFEMSRWLIHFYERHENEIHSDASRDRISAIVDKNLVLRIIADFGLHYAHRYMMYGKTVSERVMTRLARTARTMVPLPTPVGLHARPAYYITLVVEEHGTDTFLHVGGRRFDARSVLDLLEAGGMAADLEVNEVEFEGDERTLADLKILAAGNYCENENIPKELYYIRVARNIMP